VGTRRYSAKDFVVVNPGNGSAVQGAINSLPPTGGTVYLKAGLYPFSQAVLVPSNIHVTGDPNALVRMDDGVDDIAFTNDDRVNGNVNIWFSGFTLDGNKETMSDDNFATVLAKHTGASGAGIGTIDFHKVENLRIENMTILNGYASGIEVQFCSNFFINNNKVKRAADDGIAINRISFDGTVTDNAILESGLGTITNDGTSGLEVQDGSHHITVKGNSITDSKTLGITVSNHEDANGCFDITVIGNSIRGLTHTTGIEITGQNNNILITAVSNGSSTISYGNDSVDRSKFFIPGNKFRVHQSDNNNGYWIVQSVAFSDPDTVITCVRVDDGSAPTEGGNLGRVWAGQFQQRIVVADNSIENLSTSVANVGITWGYLTDCQIVNNTINNNYSAIETEADSHSERMIISGNTMFAPDGQATHAAIEFLTSTAAWDMQFNNNTAQGYNPYFLRIPSTGGASYYDGLTSRGNYHEGIGAKNGFLIQNDIFNVILSSNSLVTDREAIWIQKDIVNGLISNNMILNDQSSNERIGISFASAEAYDEVIVTDNIINDYGRGGINLNGTWTNGIVSGNYIGDAIGSTSSIFAPIMFMSGFLGTNVRLSDNILEGTNSTFDQVSSTADEMPDGVSTSGNEVYNKRVLTGTANIEADDNNKNYQVDCTSLVTANLPPAVVGLRYPFNVTVGTNDLRLNPDGSEFIYLPDGTLPNVAGDYITNGTANAAFDQIIVECTQPGRWVTYAAIGTWTEE
jgi:hypothetical protein